jgi:hypothetical protein
MRLAKVVWHRIARHRIELSARPLLALSLGMVLAASCSSRSLIGEVADAGRGTGGNALGTGGATTNGTGGVMATGGAGTGGAAPVPELAFGPRTALPISSVDNGGQVAIADVDGDGWPDLVAATGNNGDLVVMLSAQGTFSAGTGATYGTGGHQIDSLAVGDLDRDGDVDVVVSTSSRITTLTNDGNGHFAPPVGIFDTAAVSALIAVADFDRDGRLDVVVTLRTEASLYMLMQTSPGSFSAKGPFVTAPAPSTTALALPTGIAVADFGRDGLLDLVVGDDQGSLNLLRNVSASPNLGNVMFEPPVAYLVGHHVGQVISADFDGDGFPDVAAARYDDVDAAPRAEGLAVLLNDGAQSFHAPSFYPSGTQPRRLAVGDFNGDRRPDVALANFTTADISLLLNTGSGVFAKAASLSVVANPFQTSASGGTLTALAVGDLDDNGRAADVVSSDGSNVIIYKGPPVP